MTGFRIFSIGDIPVHLSPIFLLLLVFWMSGGDIAAGLVWGGVVTFSILVHELGHAVVARRFRLQPSILLHGLGGLCFHQPAKTQRDEALIVAAGPGAGLLLGCLTVAFIWSGIDITTTQRGAHLLNMVLTDLLYVNFFWSLVNLLPLYPLDGGRLFQLLLYRFVRPPTADLVTHRVGLVLSLVWVGVGVAFMHSMFMAILGLWIAADNYRALRGGGSGVVAVPKGDNKFARELIGVADKALAEGDYREAVRLSHQIRSESYVPEKVLSRVWHILGIANARLGNHAEALSSLRRAPETAATVEAAIECLHMLDRADELQELIASPAFKKIGSKRRAEILAVVAPDGPAG